MGQLEGQVALITGGGSGLGLAIVDRFRAEGASVAVLELAAERARDLPSDVVTTVGDVRSSDDNTRAVEAAVARFGRLDIFVGNAGVYDNRMPLDGYELDRLPSAFDELFGVNVKGYLLGARTCRQQSPMSSLTARSTSLARRKWSSSPRASPLPTCRPGATRRSGSNLAGCYATSGAEHERAVGPGKRVFKRGREDHLRGAREPADRLTFFADTG